MVDAARDVICSGAARHALYRLFDVAPWAAYPLDPSCLAAHRAHTAHADHNAYVRHEQCHNLAASPVLLRPDELRAHWAPHEPATRLGSLDTLRRIGPVRVVARLMGNVFHVRFRLPDTPEPGVEVDSTAKIIYLKPASHNQPQKHLQEQGHGQGHAAGDGAAFKNAVLAGVSQHRSGGLRLCAALLEVLAWAIAQPNAFLGHVYVRDAAGKYAVVLFVQKFRNTLSELVNASVRRTLAIWNDDERRPEAYALAMLNLPYEVLASMAQLFLVVLPRLKRRHGLCHTDLKVDNVMYERRDDITSVVVRHASGRVLQVPTYGRLFVAIDFGWTTLRGPEGALLRSAEAKACAPSTIRAYDPETNRYQLAVSLRRALHPVVAGAECAEGWAAVKAAVEALCGALPPHLAASHEINDWYYVFYTAASDPALREAPAPADPFDLFAPYFELEHVRDPHNAIITAYTP